MNKNTWLGLVFFLFVIVIAWWKWWAWLIWMYLRLKDKDKVFKHLIQGGRQIEITGSSGIGKSWLLMHLFKQFNGVKFTNCPTPQSTYTLTRETFETHLIGKWSAPNKWFYFLDDINSFEKWTNQKFGDKGTQALQEFLIAQAPKLGAVSIWTNNGTKEHIFSASNNVKWEVWGKIKFFDKSLLLVNIKSNFINILPTIFAIDNLEIESYYDPHWNIPRHYQSNWLEYLAERLGANELNDIIEAIKEGNFRNLSLKEADHNIYRKLLDYVKLREKEEQFIKIKSQQISKVKAILKKKAISDEKITLKEVEKWEKTKQATNDLKNARQAKNKNNNKQIEEHEDNNEKEDKEE